MKALKQISLLLLILLLVFNFTFSAFAHPGRLDSNGGHYNRATGEYHYHDGTHSSGTSNSNNSINYNYNDNDTHKAKSKSYLIFLFIEIILLICTIIYIIFKSKEFNSSFKDWLHTFLFTLIIPYSSLFLFLFGLSTFGYAEVKETLFYSLIIYNIPITIITIRSIYLKIKNLCEYDQAELKNTFRLKSKKERKKKEYATILRNELIKLNAAKADLNRKYAEVLKHERSKIEFERSEISFLESKPLCSNYVKLRIQKHKYDKKYLSNLLTDEYINQTIEFPKGIIYKDNKLEDLLSSEIYGRFTAYIAPHGRVIHFKEGCSQAYSPINITETMRIRYIYSPKDFNPSIDDYIIDWQNYAHYDFCKKCGNRNKKKFFIMPKWYEQYLKIQKIKERYNIK